MNKNIQKGKLGEDLACEFLLKKGYRIVERNWRYSRFGEIDIIIANKNSLVFVEVKARTGIDFGHPVEAVNNSKMKKIRTLAEIYLAQNPNLNFENIRFDIVGILLKQQPEFTHYEDV